MIPQNDILVLIKTKVENVSAGGIVLGENSDTEPVGVYEVAFKNEAYGYEVGEKLLVAKGKTVKSRFNGVDYYYVKVTDIWATV